MQPSIKAFLAATAVAFGMYSPFAMAQGNAAPANSAAPAATQVVKPTDSQLEQYARTYKKVAQTASEYQPRLDAAKSDAERQSIVQEADQRLKNRNLLWDVELNPEDEAGFEAAALPKPPYAYQSE